MNVIGAGPSGYVCAIRTARFPLQAKGKARGLGDYGGWVKRIVDEKRDALWSASDQPGSGRLLPRLTPAREAGLGIEAIARNVHSHPILSEVLMEAARGLDGGYIQQ